MKTNYKTLSDYERYCHEKEQGNPPDSSYDRPALSSVLYDMSLEKKWRALPPVKDNNTPQRRRELELIAEYVGARRSA